MYLGEKKMKTYKEHYEKSRKASNIKSSMPPKYSSPYEISIDTELLNLNDEYHRLVKIIAEKIKYKLDNEPSAIHEERFTLYVNKWRDISEIEELANLILPQIEQNVFHSKLKVEFVLPYRNKITDLEPIASWIWHYDDCTPEFLKLAIYLNETTEDNGCFQYVRGSSHVPVIPSHRDRPGPPRKQIFPGSRVPQHHVDGIISKGGKVESLLGPCGTYALFTPNIIHRATKPLPSSIPREALFFFIRPSIKQGNFIDKDTNSVLPKKDVKRYTLD